jgi:hypothetical protein
MIEFVTLSIAVVVNNWRELLNQYINYQSISVTLGCSNLCVFQEGHLTSLADFRQFGAEMARVSSYALKDGPVL